MIGQKLVNILRQLEAAEFRRLGDAFASPYFTASKLLPRLYDLLKKAWPDFEESRLDKQKIFRKLYPGKPFNDGQLRVLVREFTKVTEDFLLLESLQNDDFTRKKMLTRWYGSHQLYADFARGTRELLAQSAALPYRDADFFEESARLHFAYFFHPATEKHTLDDNALVQLMDSIDQQYILTKLRVASEMKNRERILSKHYDIRMLQEIRDMGGAGLLQANAPFQLYELLVRLYDEEQNPDIFPALKALLAEALPQLRVFDQSMLLTQLINYAVRQLNKGNSGVNKEVLDLYKLGLQYQLVSANQKIEAAVFRNIVRAGCLAQEFDWTRDFIESYHRLLDEAIRSDEKTMAFALLFFEGGDYDAAIELLGQYHFTNPLLQMHTRVILLKAWFEKFLLDSGYFDLLMYQLEAYEKYVRRDAVIVPLRKEEILNFILMTKRLATYILQKKYAPESKSALVKYLDEQQSILAKDWLKLKLDQAS